MAEFRYFSGKRKVSKESRGRGEHELALIYERLLACGVRGLFSSHRPASAGFSIALSLIVRLE